MHNYMKHLIVIDDTGSSGNFTESRFLKENRKTLVAVFIHSELRKYIEEIMLKILSILKKEFNISELHFADLINKNREFKNFETENVFEIVEQISIIFSQIELPFFVQTVHNKTLKENGIYIKGKVVIDKLDLNKNEDNALFMLLNKLKIYFKKEYPQELIEFVMDEGNRKKNGQTETFKILEGLSVNSEISFKSSAEFPLLQVADFFAYSVNRMQTTMIKETRTNYDNTIIKHLSYALKDKYSEGITKIEVDLENFTKNDYDNIQLSKREIDGNLTHWKKAQE